MTTAADTDKGVLNVLKYSLLSSTFLLPLHQLPSRYLSRFEEQERQERVEQQHRTRQGDEDSGPVPPSALFALLPTAQPHQGPRTASAPRRTSQANIQIQQLGMVLPPPICLLTSIICIFWKGQGELKCFSALGTTLTKNRAKTH